MKVDKWLQETISGTKNYTKRVLGRLIRCLRKGDTLVCSELSRLGRNLFMIMEILGLCMKKECRVWTIKDGYRLGDDIQSKVLAFAFGLSAEIERNLISQRTREALKRCKAEGVVLGHPRGRLHDVTKLTGKETALTRMLLAHVPIANIALRLKVSRNTVYAYIHRHNIDFWRETRRVTAQAAKRAACESGVCADNLCDKSLIEDNACDEAVTALSLPQPQRQPMTAEAIPTLTDYQSAAKPSSKA